MFKKQLIASAAFLFSSTICFANSFLYVAPTVVLQNISSDDSSNFRSLSPRLGFGYAAELAQGLFLAGEVNVTAWPINLSSNDDDGDTDDTNNSSLEIKTTFDVSILPGMMFSENTLGYIRLGVASAQFEESDDSVIAGELGIGLQTALANCWYIRGEYIYTTYASVDDISSPSSDTFALSFIYAFN